jgi:MFS family permease
MTNVLATVACIVALAAAVRSTWSPCGLSMLATITPLAEEGRGHRYRTTALWFVAGSVLGGASLGAVMALLALAVHALGWASTGLASVAVVAAAISFAADARIRGFHLPLHHRQVNERWLDQFRPWVYGAGFGWQIGAGLATYIKTCAVYLMIVLAALTGSPAVALLVGTLFGLVRGLAVFLCHRITSATALADFHRRFVAADRYALAGVLICEAAATLLISLAVSPWAGAAAAFVLCSLIVLWSLGRHQATHRDTQPLRLQP